VYMPRFIRSGALPTILDKLLLPLIVSLGGFLQFFRITSYSLGFDESYSVYLIHFKISKLLYYVSKDNQPPFFFLMLKAWTKIFGDGVLAVRSLSALCMILVIPTGFFLVKELFNKRAAYLAALFLATGPFMLRYGHEARMYAPMALFTLLATYILVMVLRKHLPMRLGFTIYTITMIAAVYSHYYSFLILPSQWILVMAIKGQKISLENCLKNLKTRAWLWSQVAIFLAYLPWIPYAYTQLGKVETAFWLPPVRWGTIPTTFLNFTAYQDKLSFNYGLLAVFIILLIIILILLYQMMKQKLVDSQRLLFLISAVVFGPVLIFIVSTVRSVYYDRYFIYAAVFFYILLAVVLAQSYRGIYKMLQLIGIIAALLLFIVGIIRVDRPQYDDISSLMTTINSESTGHNYQVVVLDHTLYYQIEYYDQSRIPATITEYASLGGYGDMTPVENNPRLIAAPYRITGIVWVVYYGGSKEVIIVPSNWHLLNEGSVYYGVQAREYTVGRV
jgi:mannosyltransferase